MLFFQEGPAETTGFMILGFSVIFGVLLLHIVSLIVRRRNMLKDLELLKDLDE